MRRAAVLGSPISHSLSPDLHRAAYRALGLDWEYTAIEMAADGLADFVDGLDETWVGLSLTMPLKEAARDLAASMSGTVAVTGSANTLLLPDLAAHNTDVDGIRTAFRRAGLSGSGFPAVVVGSGATARSAVVALHRMGADRVTVCARHPARAADLAALAESIGLPASVRPLDGFTDCGASVAVCTLPAGAGDALEVGELPSDGWLLDVVYERWPTLLASAWVRGGGTAVSGLEMLLAQAERQVELMTGRSAPTQDMRRALPGSAASS